jgi:hypothetical protein
LFALNRKNTINKKQSIGITVVAVAVLSLLIAGTILAPTQASAISQRSVSVNREHRDQHIGQENLCYRTNTCRQSDVGQNTLGNDNSVTGFADQSDNIQQSAAANNTTPTLTSTPSPIPAACPAGTVFDVTIQQAGGFTEPGTVLCLKTSGVNRGIVAILPTGGTKTTGVDVVPLPPDGKCLVVPFPPIVYFKAAITSGTAPFELTGGVSTTVCVLTLDPPR